MIKVIDKGVWQDWEEMREFGNMRERASNEIE